MNRRLLLTMLLALLPAALPVEAASPRETLLKRLNEHPSIAGTDSSKSYRLLFDAYLRTDPPPMEIGEDFNASTIHPGMENWSTVAGWAESNNDLAEALIESRDRLIIGLPYGADNVPANYRDAGLMVEIAVNNNPRKTNFAYFDALDTIVAFATAETYRLMEAGESDKGLDVAMATIFVLRQFCDRDFLEEKRTSINLLTLMLANLRDVFWSYREQISVQRFGEIGGAEMPYLRPDRNRLFIPEADRVVAEVLLGEVFDDRSGNPDPEMFAHAFAGIQSANEPLTRFGAARRWKMISTVHGSFDASKERLQLVYDDWWRRWRVQEYDEILAIPSEFARTNEVRYAAVLYAIQDIQSLFPLRNVLVASVNGTAMAAGICAYMNELGTAPDDAPKIYSMYIRKLSDADPFDLYYGPFRFRLVRSEEPVDTAQGRIRVPSGNVLLYSKGQNLEDDRARQHTGDGAAGDIVFWPPVRALLREQGRID